MNRNRRSEPVSRSSVPRTRGDEPAAQNRLDQIDKLANEIDKTKDLKGLAELQGRIADEQACIQNQKTRLELYQQLADARERVNQQRQHEINVKLNARRGYVDIPEIQW